MIDIHNHIIHGIDDGAQTLDDALELLQLATENGISHLICTPHMHPGRFDNNRDTIAPPFAELDAAVKERNMPIKIAMSAEVRISDEFMIMLRRGKVPFIGQWEGMDCVLLEMPHSNVPVGIENLLSWLKKQNIRPIIAHPERNKEIMRHPERSLKLAERGALFQLTAGSVAGHFGSQAQEISQWMLSQEKELIQFVASDAHNVNRRPPAMREAAVVLDQWVGEAQRVMLTETNPHQLTASLFGEAS
ncbi:tyrosine-protein phosphatase [Spongorhabdus nitratireducens]